VPNCPSVFTIIWKAVKPMIDPKTQAKVKIFGTEFKKEMSSDIDETQIVDFLGGPIVWKFPHGGSFGGTEDGTTLLPTDITIGSREIYEQVVKVEKNGSAIAYEFKVESLEIVFGIFIEDDKIDPKTKKNQYEPNF